MGTPKKQTITEEFEDIKGQMLVKGQVVQTYADNDGGAWYWDPETGERKAVKE